MSRKLTEWGAFALWLALVATGWSVAEVDGVILALFVSPVAGYLALALFRREVSDE